MNIDPKREAITVQHLPPRRVAFVRHVGPYARCSDAWDKLCAYLGKEGFLAGNNQFIGLCYDDPGITPPDKVRYDACITVDADIAPHGEIGVQTIAGGDYAVTTHFGPYVRLQFTYVRIFGQWLPQSGREADTRPSLEAYLNDPQSNAPEDLITDVYVPLK